MTSNKKYKLAVLAIDGGGIRGIVPAKILAKIEDITGEPIHKLFDLIAGTSTGGILSLGLVKPNEDGNEAKFSAQYIANLYENEREKIFKKQDKLNLPAPLDKLPHNKLVLFKLLQLLRSLPLPFTFNPEELLGPKFTRSEKINTINTLLGETPLNQALTEIIITSYAIEKRKPFLFTSNPYKELKSENFYRICSNYKMYHAALATSAAPTYFRPYDSDFISSNIENELFVDGGVIANNPTSIAIIEAIESYKKQINPEIGLKDILVVSLGTGRATDKYSKETKEWGLFQWVKPLINMVFNGQSEIIDYQMEHLLSKEQYYRFQFKCEKRPSQPNTDQKYYVSEAMDDTSEENIEELKKAADKLIKEQSSDLTKLCEVLKASLETRELRNNRKI
ncbi:MAG: patatin-like phospholipase family protein [Mojavia pulchra JT2-VF2]|jgi:patatin-like phospholipase/acyl hydrolase|uniref:Patatin-like phospholipase family protein n=1 Tax=Mojavia pulchra JT2-VF2 TaxID=287848 RepID=A0A951UJB8_9NOST|nr:patatin-like phospholipase family protein [Mojavia pulchra JT2-VF2]